MSGGQQELPENGAWMQFASLAAADFLRYANPRNLRLNLLLNLPLN
jgi:hypothetical protein